MNGNEDYTSWRVSFDEALNLDQVNLNNWAFAVLDEDAVDDTGRFSDDTVTPHTGIDGSLYFVSSATPAAGDRVVVEVSHASEGAEVFQSPTFRVPTSAVVDDSDVDDVFILPATGSVHNQSGDVQGEDSDFEIPVGQKVTTYNLQLAEDEDAVAFANVPVMVVAYQAGELDEDATIQISGANVAIDSVNGAVVASGVTDSTGKWTFTVNHSSATAGEGYFLNAYYADDTGNVVNGTDYTVTYSTPSPSEIEASSTLLAGTDVTVSFEVTDQFGRAVSKAGTRDLSVALTSSDGEDLDLAAAVSATGEVTFSFTNYLSVAGSSDTLTAQVFTGTATNPTTSGLPRVTLDLYNAKAAGSVSAPAVLNTTVTYSDFITGKASSTNIAPDADNGLDASLRNAGVPLTATIRDAAGLGIPGAVATVAGAGFQFKDAAGNYAKDSITVVADSNGQFTVTLWTHLVSPNGTAVTVTSGDKATSTLVKSYLPTGLNGDVLDFGFTVVPGEIAKSTTYSVTAKLSDKWGNPIPTQGANAYAVVFESSGSVQLNGTVDPILRNFGRDGSVTVFVRAVDGIAGKGELTASLLSGANYEAWTGSGVGNATISDTLLNSTDLAGTAWNEVTEWTPELVATLDVLNAAPVTGKVNVGSFNGKLVVYAAGLNGRTISWKVAGKWGKQVATSDYVRFDRPVGAAGLNVIVEIYVDGQRMLTKTVLTR